MKKMMSVLLSMILLASGMAMAEDAATEVSESIIGRIAEMLDEGYLIDTLDGTQMQVLLGEDTAIETDGMDRVLGLGDVITVIYDGTVAQSVLPQVTAQAIRSFSMEGIISEVNVEGNRVLLNSPESGQVWVTLPDDVRAEDFAGETVRVYFNGVMALSFPAQIHAFTIEPIVAVGGTVEEVGDGFFMLAGTESAFRVNFDEHTKVTEAFEAGGNVQVYYSGISTRSMPPQIYANAVIKVDAAG